jgi:hypothetical protein
MPRCSKDPGARNIINKIAAENIYGTEAADGCIKSEFKTLEVRNLLREGVADLGINSRGEIN